MNRTARTGQVGQESTAGGGELRQKSRERIESTGRSEYGITGRTNRTGKVGCDSNDRTAGQTSRVSSVGKGHAWTGQA